MGNEWTDSAPASDDGRLMPDAPARPVLKSKRCTARPAHCCRQIADKTPHHGPSRLSTRRHQVRAEPWTVQHLCTRAATARHAFGMIPKPGVGCSIQPGGTTLLLLRAISILPSPPRWGQALPRGWRESWTRASARNGRGLEDRGYPTERGFSWSLFSQRIRETGGSSGSGGPHEVPHP
jgi:hypothetical protein